MIEISKDKIVLTSNFTPEQLFSAQCIGFAADTNGKTLVANLKEVSPNGMKAGLEYLFPSIFGPNVVSTQVRDHVNNQLREAYKVIYRDFVAKNESEFPVHETGEKLMKHQIMDLIPLINRKNNLLAWEQGVGKTIELYAISKLLGVERTVVICPAFVKRAWYRGLVNEWGVDPTVFTIYDSAKSKTIKAFFDEKIVIVNYEMAGKFFDQITDGPKIGHIVIDECQKLKNSATSAFKGVAKLVKKYPDAKITLASGTPVTNRFNDLLAYLRLTSHPLGNDKKLFENRYLDIGSRGKVIGVKNEKELFRNISSFMFRRTTAETLSLKPSIIHKMYFQLDEYKAEYEAVLDEIRKSIEERERYRVDNSTVIQTYEEMRYRVSVLYAEKAQEYKSSKRALDQFRKDNIEVLEKYINDTNLRSLSSLNSLNIVTSMAKINGVMEMVDNMISEGVKVAIFGGYHKPLEALKARLGDKAVLITGKTSLQQRNLSLEKFVEDPECLVYLANFEAGGVGINGLQHVCNNVIVLNMPFTPDKVEQAIARLDRKGQKNPVNIYYAICEQSIDEDLFALVSEKSRDINSVINHGKVIAMVYDDIQETLFSELIRQLKVA